MKFRYIPYTIFSLLLTVAVNAQTKPEDKKPDPAKPASGTLTEEIEVVRPYKPVLADAAKIRRSPDLNNHKPFRPNQTYLILDKRLELNSDIRQLDAQPLNAAPAPLFENNYAKLGFGNYGTALGELYLNTGNDEALQAGFFMKHLGQSGDLNKQRGTRQEVGIYGKSIMEKITVNGELGFDRLSTNFYAVNPNIPNFNPDPKKQRFSTISLKGELLKNYEQTQSSLDYAIKADAYTLSSRYGSKETSFALSGFFNNTYKQFNVGVNSSIDFTKTKDSLDIGNHIFRANPYVKFQGKNYKISVGVNFVQEFGENSRTNILPVVIAELPVVPGYATIFGGYTGDVLKSSLRNFAYENPYLRKNLIENAIEKANVYGGVKGNAGAGFGFKAMVYFKTIQNMPLYANSPEGLERFEIRYDGGNSKVIGLEGELNVKASEVLSWTGKVEINKYDMATEEKAWMKPGIRLHSNARLALNKKIRIDGQLVLNGDTDALTYEYAEGLDPQPRIVTIKSYVDLSAGAEYLIKDKFGVFVRVNNLFGNKYQQFLYYPKFGINAIAGLNYSF